MKKLSFDDVKKIVSVHKARNITYIELYKKFFMRVMDRQVELDKKESTRWMSNISSPILYMLTMAVFGMYQDSKVAFEVYRKIKRSKWVWLTEDEQKAYDEEVTKTNKISNNIIDLFESIYEKCDGSDEFDMSVLDAIILGNWFWWIGYEKSESKYKVTNKDWWEDEIIEKINIPNVYRIVPLNFFTELSANSQRKAKINIVRRVKTAERINADYEIYWIKYTTSVDSKWDILEKKDWNMVLRFIIFNNMPFITTLKELWLNSDTTNTLDWDVMHTDIRSDNNFKIGDDVHEIYEVHTDTTIQIFIDGVDQWWLFPRLGPWKEKPIYKIWFRDWLNWLYDIGIGYLWYNFHKVIDSFLNMRVDNDRLAGTSPLVVNADDNYFDGMDYLEQFPGKLIKVKDVNQWPKKIEYSTSWSSVANQEIELLWKTVQEAVGVSWYQLWVQQKVERSAKWVSELIESADASMKSFISSIAKAKWFIAKYITLLALEYMDEDSIENMSWNRNLKEDLEITSFINDYSFNFNIQSVSSLRERQELEILKWIIKDFGQVTRPDGTPLFDQEDWFRQVLEKTWAPESLLLTEDEALEYMKAQITRNAELKKLEAWSLPPGWTNEKWEPLPQEWWIVPEVGVKPEMGGGAAPVPGTQWWSLWAGMPGAPNQLWNNWQVL